jgi:hypothetical protein
LPEIGVNWRAIGGFGLPLRRRCSAAHDANAFVESWIGSLKRECLNHFVCFSLGHLDHITRQFVRFCNDYRPHESLGARTLPEAAGGPPAERSADHTPQLGRVRCEWFLAGLPRLYTRAAA